MADTPDKKPEYLRIPEGIPDLPREVFEAGWVRDGVKHPSFKQFLYTAHTELVYDFYVDFLIEGEPHTYFMRRTTIEDIVSEYDGYIDILTKKVKEMVDESGEEYGYIPIFTLNYVWRSVKPIEVEVKE